VVDLFLQLVNDPIRTCPHIIALVIVELDFVSGVRSPMLESVSKSGVGKYTDSKKRLIFEHFWLGNKLISGFSLTIFFKAYGHPTMMIHLDVVVGLNISQEQEQGKSQARGAGGGGLFTFSTFEKN
jgi:hypothetical protein